MLKFSVAEKIKELDNGRAFSTVVVGKPSMIRMDFKAKNNDGGTALRISLSSKSLDSFYSKFAADGAKVKCLHAWFFSEYVVLSTRVLDAYNKSTLNPRITTQGSRLNIDVLVGSTSKADNLDVRFNVLTTAFYCAVEKLDQLETIDEILNMLDQSKADQYVGAVDYYNVRNLTKVYENSLGHFEQLHGDTRSKDEQDGWSWGGDFSRVSLNGRAVTKDIKSIDTYSIWVGLEVSMDHRFIYKSRTGHMSILAMLDKRLRDTNSPLTWVEVGVHLNAITLAVNGPSSIGAEELGKEVKKVLLHLARILENLSYLVDTLGVPSATVAIDNLGSFVNYPNNIIKVNK